MEQGVPISVYGYVSSVMHNLREKYAHVHSAHPLSCWISYTLANMPVRCNGRKKIHTSYTHLRTLANPLKSFMMPRNKQHDNFSKKTSNKISGDIKVWWFFEVYWRCLEFIIQHKYLPSCQYMFTHLLLFLGDAKKYCIRMKIANYILVFNDNMCISVFIYSLRPK